jgi:HPt (histidine-containing phosphotransfer) domain-containing protein
MFERVSALETAAGPLSAGNLTDAQREMANSSAHKLAGILGSFGLPEGTVLAREAEALCSSGPGAAPAAAARLWEITVVLRSLIQNRK